MGVKAFMVLGKLYRVYAPKGGDLGDHLRILYTTVTFGLIGIIIILIVFFLSFKSYFLYYWVLMMKNMFKLKINCYIFQREHKLNFIPKIFLFNI